MFGTYRVLLALMVVALHLGGIPAIGSYAVFGFYILSGYLMTFIMQNSYGYSFAGVYRYGINRILRIYPLYWVSIIFSLFLLALLGESFSVNYHESIYYPDSTEAVLKNLFLFFPDRESPRLTPPAWALTVELFYYALIGLGLSKNRKRVLLWLSASLVYHIVAVVMGFGWEERYFALPAASLPFATGAFIYFFRQEMSKRITSFFKEGEDYAPFVIFFAILLNWCLGYLTSHLRDVFFYTNYLLCFLMVGILSERKTLPFLSKGFDKLMGELSYPIYLIHYQVGLIVVFLLDWGGLDYIRPGLVVMLISIPLIFMFAMFLTIAIERPINLLRNDVKQSKIKFNLKNRFFSQPFKLQ